MRITDVCEMTDEDYLDSKDEKYIRTYAKEAINDDKEAENCGCVDRADKKSQQGECAECLFNKFIDNNANIPLPHTFYIGLERGFYELNQDFDRNSYNFGYEIGRQLKTYLKNRDTNTATNQH